MCGARIQAVMTRGMDGGLMRLRIHSSSGERLGGKRSEMKMTLVIILCLVQYQAQTRGRMAERKQALQPYERIPGNAGARTSLFSRALT